MTVKDFFRRFGVRHEPHVMIDAEGEPLGVLLSYERYAELTERERSGETRAKQAPSAPEHRPVQVLPETKTEPKAFAWESAPEDTDEPHFQFEPLPEDEGLTSH